MKPNNSMKCESAHSDTHWALSVKLGVAYIRDRAIFAVIWLKYRNILCVYLENKCWLKVPLIEVFNKLSPAKASVQRNESNKV
jgi:hypothetical protein